MITPDLVKAYNKVIQKRFPYIFAIQGDEDGIYALGIERHDGPEFVKFINGELGENLRALGFDDYYGVMTVPANVTAIKYPDIWQKIQEKKRLNNSQRNEKDWSTYLKSDDTIDYVSASSVTEISYETSSVIPKQQAHYQPSGFSKRFTAVAIRNAGNALSGAIITWKK